MSIHALWVKKIRRDDADVSHNDAMKQSAQSPAVQNNTKDFRMKAVKLFALTLSASLLLSSAAFAQDIRVAVASSITGGEAAFGRQFQNGAEQAIADINAAGGLLNKKLVLDVNDDACDPKQARSVAEK